jgi:hypothetical protein
LLAQLLALATCITDQRAHGASRVMDSDSETGGARFGRSHADSDKRRTGWTPEVKIALVSRRSEPGYACLQLSVDNHLELSCADGCGVALAVCTGG